MSFFEKMMKLNQHVQSNR